jgi:hypothetical protein
MCGSLSGRGWPNGERPFEGRLVGKPQARKSGKPVTATLQLSWRTLRLTQLATTRNGLCVLSRVLSQFVFLGRKWKRLIGLAGWATLNRQSEQ